MANTPQDIFLKINMLTGPIHPQLNSRCWPWTGALNKSGRPYYKIGNKTQLVYRVAYELYTGASLEGKVARHKCDNPICCNPEHIEAGSHIDNMKDMRDRERHGLPHYTVRAIRKLGAEGRTHKEIAELYGLGRSTVSEIISFKKYKDVS